jgi:hypothetical protein
VTNWKLRTPRGITVKATTKTIAQYETRWGGLFWTEIDWGRLDTIFTALNDAHVAAGHGPSVNPSKVVISIKEWKMICLKGETPPGKPRIPDPTGVWCQAYYNGGWGISINLGIDTGQGPNAFCLTPLSHELNHLILVKMKSRCKGLGEFGGSSDCSGYDISLQSFGLCM